MVYDVGEMKKNLYIFILSLFYHDIYVQYLLFAQNRPFAENVPIIWDVNIVQAQRLSRCTTSRVYTAI